MEAFKEKYKQLCRKYQVPEQDDVLDSVKVIDEGLSLDFSTCNLTYNTCMVLSKVLHEDCTITKLCFCDCLLPYEAVMIIMDGLCTNSSVKFLHFKGNDMKASHAEDIGRFLTSNSTLQHLSLEWNALGRVSSKFAFLCRSLASNTSLKILDLRSNQIDDEGAIALADSLGKNHVLQQIDLQWNMIGESGAQALLNMLQQSNNALIQLELTGNVAVSEDLILAIESAVSRNCTLQLMQEEHITRTKELAEEIKNLNIEKSKEISALAKCAFDEERKNRASLVQIKELEKILNERKMAFDSVLSQVADLQNKLTEEKVQNKETNDILKHLKVENISLKEEQQKLLTEKKKERLEAEKELTLQINALERDKRHLELELECALRKHNMQDDKINRLQETTEVLEKKLKMLEITYNENLDAVKQSNKDSLMEVDSLKKQEMEEMKKEIDEVQKAMNESLAHSKSQIVLLEKENLQLNAKVIEEKASIDELLQQQRQRLQAEIVEQCTQLSAKVRSLQEENNLQAKATAEQNNLISDLEASKLQLQNGKENLLRTTEQLKQQISCKDKEIEAYADRTTFERQQHLEELQKERQNQVILHAKIRDLETIIIDMKQQHSAQIASRERDVIELKDKLKQTETEVSLLKQNEARRASVLITAFNSYLSGVPKQSDSSLHISDLLHKDT